MLRGLPRTAGTIVAGGWVARRTAMSFAGCVAWIVAGDFVPSAKVTSMDVAFATTCRQVRMSPLASTTTPLPMEPSAVEVPAGGGVLVGVALLPGAVELPGAAVPPCAVEPAGTWATTRTSEGWTAWYARCDRAGAGATDANAWEIRVLTSCGARGCGPGTMTPYSVTATRAAAMPIANAAPQRARLRTWEMRRDHGRVAEDGVASCGCVMKQVVCRSVSRPGGGMSVTARRTIAEDSLGHHPEVRMKAPESATGVQGAGPRAAEVCHAPCLVRELAHRWTTAVVAV